MNKLSLGLLVALLALQFNAQIVFADVTASVEKVNTWQGGGQYKVSVKNNDPSKTVCSVKFSLTPASGTSITGKWGFDEIGSNQYKLAFYNAEIAPGATNSNGGMVIQGDGAPTLKLEEANYLSNGACSGSSDGGSPPGGESSGGGSPPGGESSGGGSPPGGEPSGGGSPPNGESSGGGSPPGGESSGGGSPPGGESSGGGSSSGCMGCLADTNTDGPILAQLNKPVPNSVFTFYGGGGRGACGLDSGIPKVSAAASGKLFSPSAQWKDACRADKQYMLDDPICKDICIKIDYNGKTLTVPINNKCPECDINHVDLSIEAFNILEPRGGLVGIAKDATLTYIRCPSDIKPC